MQNSKAPCLKDQVNDNNVSLKKMGLIISIFLILSMIIFAKTSISQEEIFQPLPGEGKKCQIGQDYYCEYSFDKTPQMGTVILKIKVFDKNGNRDTSIKIAGDTGMPSMRGHHDSGMVDFQQNKKGDYLLPLNIMMPGTWDVRMIFSKDGKPIYKGSITFEV